MDQEKIIGYILAVLQGTADEKQVDDVKKWLEISIENQRKYDRLCKIYYDIRFADKWDKINETIACEKASKAIRKISNLRVVYRLSGVAALVMVFFTVVFLWKQPQNTSALVIIPDEVNKKKVVLTLSDGHQVEIKHTDMVFDLGNVMAEIDSQSGLVYKKKNDSKSQKTEYNTLKVPRGAEYILTLSDGTQVWLNSETELYYPVTFDDHSRPVYVSGEAYFNVSKNPACPFIVTTPSSQVLVYGTTFNVMAYENEERTKVTLIDGVVAVKAGDKEFEMEPGQQIRIDNKTFEMEKYDVDVSFYASWKNGLFCFDDMPLEKLMLQLERWYDVDFFFANRSAGKKRFTGAVKRDNNLQLALEFIEKTSEVYFEVKGRTITVYDGKN